MFSKKQSPDELNIPKKLIVQKPLQWEFSLSHGFLNQIKKLDVRLKEGTILAMRLRN